MTKLQKRKLTGLVQGHGSVPKVYIKKQNSFQMPSLAWDHLATLISDAVSLVKALVGNTCLRLSWNGGRRWSPGIMNSALSVSPSAPDLMWTAVSLPLTRTAFLVAPCTKLFLPWHISTGLGSWGFIGSVNNCMWARSRLLVCSPGEPC